MAPWMSIGHGESRCRTEEAPAANREVPLCRDVGVVKLSGHENCEQAETSPSEQPDGSTSVVHACTRTSHVAPAIRSSAMLVTRAYHELDHVGDSSSTSSASAFFTPAAGDADAHML